MSKKRSKMRIKGRFFGYDACTLVFHGFAKYLLLEMQSLKCFETNDLNPKENFTRNELDQEYSFCPFQKLIHSAH